jgi:hypothetical protein
LKEDEFIIMPNHLHGFVWITNVWAHGMVNVGADGIRPDGVGLFDRNISPNAHGAHRAPLQRIGKTLGSFVAGFKSGVSSHAKMELGLTIIWQRNYYEHIIRNDADYTNIYQYIQTNPQRWQEDVYFASGLTE